MTSWLPWRPNKILSRDSNYIVDVVMWPKSDSSSIYVRGLLRNRSTSWQKIFFKKYTFFFIRFILLMFGWTKKSILYFYPMNRQSSGGFQRYTTFGKICRTYTSYKKFLILLIRLNVLIPNHVITINKA